MNRTQSQLLTELESAHDLLASMASHIVGLRGKQKEEMQARADAVAQAIEMLTLIERLREEEGDGVTFYA